MNRLQIGSTRRAVGILLALTTAACLKVDHIVLEPKQPFLRTTGESVHMIAHCMTAHVEDAEARVKWTVEDPKIAKVTDEGVVSGLSSGRTSVIATTVDSFGFLPGHRDISASIPVEVKFVEKLVSVLPKVELSRDSGDAVDPKITVLSYDGLPLKDRALEYTVKDPTVCRVDKSGQFWPIEIGETVVTAAVGGKTLDVGCIVAK